MIDEAAKVLRNAAGNYYVNDKSTGSIVAQQPFGGARASGKTWCSLHVTRSGNPSHRRRLFNCPLSSSSRNQRQTWRSTLRPEMDVAAGGEADPRPPHRLEVPLHGLRGTCWSNQSPRSLHQLILQSPTPTHRLL